MDPEDALGAMVAALGQEGALLGAGEDIHQATVRDEEEMQDLGLEAQQAAVFRLHESWIAATTTISPARRRWRRSTPPCGGSGTGTL